jgi:hypothetical protein
MTLSRSRLSWASCALVERMDGGDVPAVNRQLASDVSPSANELESTTCRC